MLKLKVLKGPEPQKVFELHPGDNVVGRTPNCDVFLSSSGISKKHAKFSVQGDKCVVTDLNSSNGTFVNGTKITDRILRVGDRVAFHDIILELLAEEIHAPMTPQGWNQHPSQQQSAAYDMQPSFAPQGFAPPGFAPPGFAPQAGQSAPLPQREAETLLELAQKYVDKTILPGVYKLAEMYPLSNVLAVFVALFVLMVTSLSTIPMAALTRDGVQKEAQRRALTIARQLAVQSEHLIATGGEANIRTDLAENEDGVVSALVVSEDDGHIIAPLSKSESYSNDQFVALARKHVTDAYYISDIGTSSIGVGVPIHGFSQEMGQQVVLADAIIVYKMDSVDLTATVGLFARILIIALLLGSILFFLLYRLITQPIIDATEQLDGALRGEKDLVETKFDFDVLKKFLDNVNSAVGRMGKGSGSQQPSAPVDREGEAGNLVRIISNPAFALDHAGLFLQVNTAFEELTGQRHLTLQGQGLDALQDQALKLNLEDLIMQCRNQMGKVLNSQLGMSGVSYDIYLQMSPHDEKPDQFCYVFGTLNKRSDE